MITTASEYLQKMYCIECKFGTKVVNYINNVRLGTSCEHTKNNLIDISKGLMLLRCYDRRDIGLVTITYNKLTLTEMECLMEILNNKLQ